MLLSYFTELPAPSSAPWARPGSQKWLTSKLSIESSQFHLKEPAMNPKLRTRITLFFAASITAACVAYAPYPGSNYDRAWNAALGGVQDAGVTLTQAEPENGFIRGTRNGIDVTVKVVRQADGSVRVQFDTKGDIRNDPQLGDRFSQAYDRRMGRSTPP
jgi:hypothetical protein